MLNEAALAPADTGAKNAEIEHVAPTASELPQLFD